MPSSNKSDVILFLALAVTAVFGTVFAGILGFAIGVFISQPQSGWRPLGAQAPMQVVVPYAEPLTVASPQPTLPTAAPAAVLPIVRVAPNTVTATPIPLVTSEPILPTDTPQPVYIPPTSTSTPMPTLPPAAVATPSVSPDLQAYVQAIATPFDQLLDGMKAAQSLMATPNVADDNWKMQMALQIYLIDDAHEKLSAITPPPIAAQTHSALIAATTNCSAAYDRLADGIDHLDALALQDAVRLIEQCGTGMNEAQRQLEAAVGL